MCGVRKAGDPAGQGERTHGLVPGDGLRSMAEEALGEAPRPRYRHGDHVYEPSRDRVAIVDRPLDDGMPPILYKVELASGGVGYMHERDVYRADAAQIAVFEEAQRHWRNIASSGSS